jgi:hypothetical protein
VREEASDFIDGEDDGETVGPFGADGIQVGESDVQDVFIEEEQGGESLVLGASGDVLLDGEVGEEVVDFRSTHVTGMSLVMEQDEASDPIGVGVFGAEGVVASLESLADEVEQFGGRWCWRFYLRRGILCSGD